MNNKNNFTQYPIASIQQELALDSLLDHEASERVSRTRARQELKTRLTTVPLFWPKPLITKPPKAWFLAKKIG